MPTERRGRETIPTAHGELEYETVRCANCEHRVLGDDAVGVQVGVSYGTDYLGEVNVTHRSNHNLCPACSDAIFRTRGDSGAIPTTLWELLWWRVTHIEDGPIFALFFAAMGAFLGLIGALGVLAVVSVIVEGLRVVL